MNRTLDGFRAHRRLVSLAAFGLVVALSYPSALWIAGRLAWPAPSAKAFLLVLGALIMVRVATAWAFGLASHRWRYVGVTEIRLLGIVVLVGSLAVVPTLVVLERFTGINLYAAWAKTALVVEPLLTILYSAGLWLTYRTAYEWVKRSAAVGLDASRVLVVGAGEAGESLVRQMLFHPSGHRPVAFVDDDWSRQGTVVHGVKVVGGTDDLAEIAKATRADEIMIAVPSADPVDMRKIVQRCQSTDLPFRVLPHIAEVLAGDVSVSQLRDVRIEDLLGREPISLELPELVDELAGKTVLITGAAGSIGSELSRQVAFNQPDVLVVLDQSETGLFFLEMELRELAPSLEIVCVVADVVDSGAVKRVFDQHRPDWVVHAAAYKHVPMMESNEREAIRNNVVGTWKVADAAGRHGAQRFVLVSTDKAVRPANVMGATKRAAEIVILELQRVFPRTAFGAVRFGNVLGSAGSVIPVFKRQLEAGKPLTVTHEGVTRFFMTIPEASQLVLQAALLPELRGRIAMLDMGEPVRILDLARTLIRLAGGGQGREPIVITGLRPGEKLHEELVAPAERSSPTRIPKINLLEPGPIAFRHGLRARIGRWDHSLAIWNLEPVMKELMQIVPELAAFRGVPTSAPSADTSSDAPATWSGSPRPDRSGRPSVRNRLRYPYGAPGFVDRRHPSNRPPDTSTIPLRRATDLMDSGGLFHAPPP